VRPDPLVAIVAYRNTADLEAALAALGPGWPLVVVDNGCDDRARAVVERHGGRYIRPLRNLGFAAAVNVALGFRDGRDVLLVNPDARASEPLVRGLQAELDADPRIAAAAPRLASPDGCEQRVLWPIPSPRDAWLDAVGLSRVVAPRREFAVGAVLLLRAEALAEVGAFDERFFLYAEESDWQFRALRRGWRVVVSDSLVAEHGGAGSSADEAVRHSHAHTSARLFALKWYGPRSWLSMRLASLVGAALRLAGSVHHADRRRRYARVARMHLRQPPLPG
jgi:GT2 family glycosyltransferase